MIRFLAAAMLAAALSTDAIAQSEASWFVAVDGIAVGSNTVTVTGILEGAQAPSSVTATWLAGNVAGYPTVAEQMRLCKELVLLAMSKPGQYKLSLSGYGTPRCALARVNP